MTDLRLPVGDVIFALRAGILCVRDGQLLVIAAQGFQFRYLPGGAVATDEDAAQAAAREWHEETGLTAGPLRLVGLIENFFELNGQRWHEIGFYSLISLMDLPSDFALNGEALADQPEHRWEWIPVSEIEAQRVYPTVIRELLYAPVGTVRHIVNRE